MATNPIRDMKTLCERLASLPPPRKGYIRVYRGQPRDYGRMVPSAFRQGAIRSNRLWDIALKPLADTLEGKSTEGELLENIAYWFKVLAQHYGPSSPFLDVTKSLEVALWFALNPGHSDPAARFSLMQDEVAFPIVCPTLYFTRAPEATGFLFVLDAPVWGEAGVPGHGELVDLAKGTPLVANSPRVKRQRGELMAAEEDHDGGDLRSFYACDPITVAQPFSGAPQVKRDPSHLFPPPEQDKWYATLLRAPLIPQPDKESGYAYRQSLGVYLVTADDTAESAAPFMDRQTQYLRPLTRLVLRAGTAAAKLRQVVQSYPDAATYIFLEAPLLTASSPVSILWNQSLLRTGLRSTATPEDAVGETLLPDVTLDNVLVEFSPLDWAFREAPGDTNYSPKQFRAAWLVRREDTFWMTLFITGLQRSQFEIQVHRIEYAQAEHAFFMVDDRDGSRSPLLEAAQAKPFFVTLTVLRDLSKSIKPDPFLSMAVDKTGLLAVRTQTAKLVRPLLDSEDLRLHFVRYVHSGARYEGPAPADEVSPAALLSLDLT